MNSIKPSFIVSERHCTSGFHESSTQGKEFIYNKEWNKTSHQRSCTRWCKFNQWSLFGSLRVGSWSFGRGRLPTAVCLTLQIQVEVTRFLVQNDIKSNSLSALRKKPNDNHEDNNNCSYTIKSRFSFPPFHVSGSREVSVTGSSTILAVSVLSYHTVSTGISSPNGYHPF